MANTKAATTSKSSKTGSSPSDELENYKAAAKIVAQTVRKLIELSVEGAKVIDLCVEGDKLIESGLSTLETKSQKGEKTTKGIAFPTSISVNNIISHFSPLPSDIKAGLKLAKDDVVKIHVGAHVDGFASVHAETIVVGASIENPVTGPRADVLKAAWTAAEIATRLIRVGERNWSVTDAVSKVATVFNCKPVEGMLSCQQSRNVVDGKKRIILDAYQGARSGVDTCTFEEGEVWGMDILVTSASDNKPKQTKDERTSIYQRVPDVTYQLKLKTSRAVFSEIQKKAGTFPFNIRYLEDEKRGRVGVQEAEKHGLLRAYDVQQSLPGTFVAAFHFTLALLPTGPYLITEPPVWYSPEKVKSEKELTDPALKDLLTKALGEKDDKGEEGAAKAAD
ncbi:peptidase M24, structural domain-containing protein [Cantharellus anzutake]|uniref:peptidase M24, structural domain-containing protein n=1 Tax=Cantharellus anzutake TaxID=1750568 RepID=UPI0019075EC0|nr:peptidase M24, structural domain-containing protein [Cantharellus anzutake]KAF8339565.1 peptidase M24, structural domain-containing protein [Cantharellus anzutake]